MLHVCLSQLHCVCYCDISILLQCYMYFCHSYIVFVTVTYLFCYNTTYTFVIVNCICHCDISILLQCLLEFHIFNLRYLNNRSHIPRCFFSGGDWLLVKLDKPNLAPDNHIPFLLHMVEDSCLTGGHWLHEGYMKLSRNIITKETEVCPNKVLWLEARLQVSSQCCVH